MSHDSVLLRASSPYPAQAFFFGELVSEDVALDAGDGGQALLGSSQTGPGLTRPARSRSSRTRSRVLGVLIALATVVLLAVTLPLIQMNRYARRIALSMSLSLGRPVHLDNVSLGLLPVPHLTLQNVVVSEDSAFGNEPIIRANVVEANLRLSSLWRSMEFSRVRFVEPSVNLVRNAEGRWNLEGVLVHAAQVNTAPTAQQHRSDAPRFPYIEATGGRVNIKVGDEKKPFSLVDADFALWLPSPEQWSVRLIGTPARTDTNLTDSGTLRVEGSLQRAAHMPQVPLSLQASWHNAPLGEATRLLTGNDQGWRGTVQVDASIRGSLGAGRLETDFTIDDLRRADFVPVHTLSLHLHCAALADVPSATLQNAACSLPTGGAQPLRLQSESIDLVQPSKAPVTVEAEGMPLDWVASWVRLFSARFPTSPVLPGSIEANLSRGAVPAAGAGRPIQQSAGDDPPAGWTGSFTLDLPYPPGVASPSTAASTGMATEAPAGGSSVDGSVGGSTSVSAASTLRGQPVTAEVSSSSHGDAWQITLPPTLVRLSANSALNVSGTATPAGYSLRAAGQASPAVLLSFARRLPPLADGLPSALGQALVQAPGQALIQTPAQAASDAPVRLDLTCSRAWSAAVSGDQTCTRAQETPRRPVTRLRR